MCQHANVHINCTTFHSNEFAASALLLFLLRRQKTIFLRFPLNILDMTRTLWIRYYGLTRNILPWSRRVGCYRSGLMLSIVHPEEQGKNWQGKAFPLRDKRLQIKVKMSAELPIANSTLPCLLEPGHVKWFQDDIGVFYIQNSQPYYIHNQVMALAIKEGRQPYPPGGNNCVRGISRIHASRSSSARNPLADMPDTLAEAASRPYKDKYSCIYI